MSKTARQVTEREFAVALCLEFAEPSTVSFALHGFYDDDQEFLLALADRLGLPCNQPFIRKLTKVVRRLVNFGVFHSRMSRTAKEYIDEPAKINKYWMRNGKQDLIRAAADEAARERRHLMTPEGEVSFLLRHAYPEDKT